MGRIKRGGRRDPGAGSGRRQPKEPSPSGSPASLNSQPGCLPGRPAHGPAHFEALVLQRGAFSGSCLLMIPKLRNANLFRADSFSKGNLPQLLIPCMASIQTPQLLYRPLANTCSFFFFFLSPFFQGGGGNGEFIENLCFLWCNETCFALLPPFLSPFHRINTADPSPTPLHVPEK